jgi:hypothetical protein
LRERLALAALLSAFVAAPAASGERDIGFLVETVCAGAGGLSEPAPLAPACASPKLREADDLVTLQRHDWPAISESDRRRQGYQRSISFAIRGQDGVVFAVQTFDFGGGERRFGRFDAERGDGGQTAVVTSQGAHIAMTEDGTGGIQWFAGSSCRGEREPLRSGWLLFGAERGADWRSSVASLRIARSSAECPAAFDRSYTRWREATMRWPFLLDGEADAGRPLLPPARTILSEHFGGASVDAADHMERFYLAEGMGLTRWERWEHGTRSRKPDIPRRARHLLDSGRCPEVDGSEPPGENWRRTDCRMWTNFVSMPDRSRVFDWRGRLP